MDCYPTRTAQELRFTDFELEDEARARRQAQQNQREQQLELRIERLETALEDIRDQVGCFMQPLAGGVALARWQSVQKKAATALKP